MKSDSEFYELARTLPVAYPLLFLGERPRGTYRASSPTLKRIELRADILLEPSNPSDAWWLVECQGRRDPQAEQTLYLKAVNLVHERKLWGRVRTGIVYTKTAFARAALSPMLGPPGSGGELQPMRVVLDCMEPEELIERGPELFPLVPLSRVDRETVSARFAGWWREARSARPLGPETLRTLKNEFLLFYAARFPGDIMEEVRRRLGKSMPIEKTRLGRDLIRLGEKRGLEKGAERELIGSILDVLKVRFRSVPVRVERFVKKRRAVERLRAMHRAALKIGSLDDFMERYRE